MKEVDIIAVWLRVALHDCCPSAFARTFENGPRFAETVAALLDDAIAFAAKDPAAHGAPSPIPPRCPSFHAILHYRLAHAVVGDGQPSSEAGCYAGLISSRGKLLSGADIHPRCAIGRRFVLDRGVGTVIGETAVIGDDCRLLGGVTLGAAGFVWDRAAKRHPTLGNRVQIGAYARLLGDIRVGDDAIVGPHCLIGRDVPAGSTVIARTSLPAPAGPASEEPRDELGPRIRDAGAEKEQMQRDLEREQPRRIDLHDGLR